MDPTGRLTRYVDSNGDPIFLAYNGWTNYVPSLIQSSAVAHTTQSGRFQRVGCKMLGELEITSTAAGTATAAIIVGLPSSSDSPNGYQPVQQTTAGSPLGYGIAALGGVVYKFMALFNQIASGVPFVVLVRTDTTGALGMGAAAPTAALANADKVYMNFCYEVVT